MGPNPSHPDAPAQHKRGSFGWGTTASSYSPPTGGHCRQIQASAGEVTAPPAAETWRFQIFTPPLKGHKGNCTPVSHTGPFEHILADADEWQELAGAQGPLPGARPRWLHRPRVGDRGLSASAGSGGRLRRGQEKHVPVLASLPAPKTKSVPSGPTARAPGTGSEAGRASAPLRLDSGSRPAIGARPPAIPVLTHHCG